MAQGAGPGRAGLWRAALWAYLGHPADEPVERQRILYAIVALRLGLGLSFIMLGWRAVFAPSADDLALRLGAAARTVLDGVAADTTLFLLGCTELATGILLIAGAFTRVAASTGVVLTLLVLLLGVWPVTPGCAGCPALVGSDAEKWTLLLVLAGLLGIVISGSPFLGVDRALDTLEEEERDHPPEVLPRPASVTPLLLRLGLALALATAAWSSPALGSPVALVLTGVVVPLLVAGGLVTRATAPVAAIILIILLLVAGQRLAAASEPAFAALLRAALPPALMTGLALACTGGGPVSLDRLLARRQ